MTVNLQPVITYLASRTGIQLPDTLYNSVESFMAERCTSRNCDCEKEYLLLLEHDREEYALFIDSVTVNETYFFREEGQFRVLEKDLVPKLLSTSLPVTLWSSSCSTGEEALSLYALMRKQIGDIHFTLYASDLNSSVLSVFKKGIYRDSSFRSDGSLLNSYIGDIGSWDGKNFVIKRDVIDAINIREVNLYSLPSKDIPLDMDLIFIRNTIIYFNLSEREVIITGLVKHLKEGGILFTSVTEVALISHPELIIDSVGSIYFFRKKSIMEKKQGMVVDEPLIERISHEKEEAEIMDDALNMETIYLMMNQKLNNPLFHLPANRHYPVALDLLEVIYCINSENNREAEELLKKVWEKTGDQPLVSYLQGLIVQQENPALAESYFSTSLEKEKEFWPARYRKAVILMSQNAKEEALEELRKTAASIHTYILHGGYQYQSLMEGFNGQYFKTICQGWIEKLSETGNEDGN